MVIGIDGGLSTHCYSCRFACHQRALKTFPSSDYLHSEDEVVLVWHFLVNLQILIINKNTNVKFNIEFSVSIKYDNFKTLSN